MTPESIEFTVFGTAEPAGSKRAFVHPHTKQIVVTDANKKARPWKDQVAQAAGRVMLEQQRELLTGSLYLEITFYEPRPRGHYGTGRNAEKLKDSAPLYPAKKPDTTKLVRGVEDAMTKVVWHDDAQVVDQVARKRYGTPARAEVVVRPMARQSVGDAEFEQSSLALAA